jgi:hypothetical protein
LLLAKLTLALAELPLALPATLAVVVEAARFFADLEERRWPKAQTNTDTAIELVVRTEGYAHRHQRAVVDLETCRAIQVLDFVEHVDVPGRNPNSHREKEIIRVKITIRANQWIILIRANGALQSEADENSHQAFNIKNFHFHFFRICPFIGAINRFNSFDLSALPSPPTRLALDAFAFGGLRREMPEKPKPAAPVASALAASAMSTAAQPSVVSQPVMAGTVDLSAQSAPQMTTASPTALSAPPVVPEILTYPKASFWERLGAAFLDVILVSILCAVGHPIAPLIALAYFSGLWAWKGTTIGGIITYMILVVVGVLNFGLSESGIKTTAVMYLVAFIVHFFETKIVTPRVLGHRIAFTSFAIITVLVASVLTFGIGRGILTGLFLLVAFKALVEIADEGRQARGASKPDGAVVGPQPAPVALTPVAPGATSAGSAGLGTRPPQSKRGRRRGQR